MLDKIKATIDYCGLNFKTEFLKIILATIFGVILGTILYLFSKEILYLIFGVLISLLFDYFLLSSYYSKKKKIDENREEEFINAISNFQVFLTNNNNVYQSFNKVIPYCSNWMKDSISKLLQDIDADKSVEPYVKFSKLFNSNFVMNIMLSIYTMIDQGESNEQLNNFKLLFEQFQKANNLSKIEKKKRSLSILSSLPLIGAGGITISLTMSIISIIGDLLNVI